MKKLIYLIILFFIIPRIYGQDKYLNPCVDLGDKIIQIKEYNEDLEKTINSKLRQEYIIRFIAKPSFFPEYVFQIEKDFQDYKIKTIILQENLWYSKNRDSIKRLYYEMTLNSLVAINLSRLFDKITSSAMNKKVYIVGGLDGETYLFYNTNEAGIKKCGECWSPSEGTPLFELVSICNTLVEMTKEGNNDFLEIDKRINLLYEKIE